MWSGWRERKRIFLIVIETLRPASNSPLCQSYSLSVICLFFFVCFCELILWLIQSGMRAGDSSHSGIWIIHIIINLLISWYLALVFHTNCRENFALPPKRFTNSKTSLEQVIGEDKQRLKCCIRLQNSPQILWKRVFNKSRPSSKYHLVRDCGFLQ